MAPKRIRLAKTETKKSHPLGKAAKIVLTLAPEAGQEELTPPYLRLIMSRGAYVGDDYHQTDVDGDQVETASLSAADKVELTRFVNNVVEIFAGREKFAGVVEEDES